MDKRVRSPNYPALGLPEAIEKVASIYRAMHTHAGPREVVAKAMGYTGLNGASATAVSALHKYGLLEKDGEEIRVSERAMRILHPHLPSERAQAIQEAGRDPALFAELAERFPGKMPNEDLLRNYLVRKGFAPAALTAVISAYRETSDMVEREAESKMASATDAEAPPAMPQHHQAPAGAVHPATLPAPQQTPAMLGSERSIGRWDFEGGAYVRIAASGEIDTEEALDMVETLIRLKRQELERANRRPNAPALAASAVVENEEEQPS
jgi:hypothetical protein